MDTPDIHLEVKNLQDLIKLLKQAQEQAEQLQKTIDSINHIKLIIKS